VKFWVHGEHLNLDQQKMSKSTGNIFTLRELLKEGYTPLQIRYALLSVPYRTKLNFTLKSLDDAKSALDRLATFVIRLSEATQEGQATERGKALRTDFLRSFEEAMDDDMNTAGALGALFTMIREANTAMDEGSLTAADRQGLLDAIKHVDSVLDLLPAPEAALDADIEKLIEARNAARANRDFKESDRLRDQLLEMGIILEDGAGGTRWRRK
jgi:cysteinyl-tRNA synthetase